MNSDKYNTLLELKTYGDKINEITDTLHALNNNIVYNFNDTLNKLNDKVVDAIEHYDDTKVKDIYKSVDMYKQKALSGGTSVFKSDMKDYKSIFLTTHDMIAKKFNDDIDKKKQNELNILIDILNSIYEVEMIRGSDTDLKERTEKINKYTEDLRYYKSKLKKLREYTETKYPEIYNSTPKKVSFVPTQKSIGDDYSDGIIVSDLYDNKPAKVPKKINYESKLTDDDYMKCLVAVYNSSKYIDDIDIKRFNSKMLHLLCNNKHDTMDSIVNNIKKGNVGIAIDSMEKIPVNCKLCDSVKGTVGELMIKIDILCINNVKNIIEHYMKRTTTSTNGKKMSVKRSKKKFYR